MSVVADVNSDSRKRCVKARIAKIARFEVELFPEARRGVRNVILPILAEVATVRVNDSGGVVVHARCVLLVEWNDDDHAVLSRQLLHEFRGWTAGNLFDRVEPARRLLGAEVGTREDLLHT